VGYLKKMGKLVAATVAVVAGLTLAPHAGAQSRSLICQLLDLGLQPESVRAVLAHEDWINKGLPSPPSSGQYTAVYYTTISRDCPEYCDGYEC